MLKVIIISGAIGLTVGFLSVIWWPREQQSPKFQTLMIWEMDDPGGDGDRITGLVQWVPGAISKEDAEKAGPNPAFKGLKLKHVFTIQGHPVAVEWARSMVMSKSKSVLIGQGGGGAAR